MSLQYHGLIRKRSSIDRSYIPANTVIGVSLYTTNFICFIMVFELTPSFRKTFADDRRLLCRIGAGDCHLRLLIACGCRCCGGSGSGSSSSSGGGSGGRIEQVSILEVDELLALVLIALRLPRLVVGDGVERRPLPRGRARVVVHIVRSILAVHSPLPARRQLLGCCCCCLTGR